MRDVLFFLYSMFVTIMLFALSIAVAYVFERSQSFILLILMAGWAGVTLQTLLLVGDKLAGKNPY